MTNEERFNLITQGLEEVLTEEDLKRLLDKKTKLKHYIGFEISGKVHLGTGIVCMMKVKDFIDAEIETTIFLADWHTWINEKLGGDLETIKRIANGYFKEALMASFLCVGGDPKELEDKFTLGSDLYGEKKEYWGLVMTGARETSVARGMRSITIMGRKEGEAGKLATLFYPMMQVADIFVLGVDIAHSGTDQRKVHVIAREVAPKLGRKVPVAVHHHLILGLGKPSTWPLKGERQELWESLKMSKSKPASAIFIHDTPEEIYAKIKKAFCPTKETEFNPILDWTKHLIFPIKNKLTVSRKKEHGGNIVYPNFSQLEKDYKDGKLHPEDLKNSVAKTLIDILEPARKHFQTGKPQKMLEELEELM